jgi:hypothetical protein
MKHKAAVVVLIIILLILLFPARVTSQWHSMPQELAGGRAGTFHFVTDSQSAADRTDLAELRASIDRVQSLLVSVSDPGLRQTLQAELQKWQLHAARFEQRLYANASPTAATAESRLNAIKGRHNCSVCHGNMAEPGN